MRSFSKYLKYSCLILLLVSGVFTFINAQNLEGLKKKKPVTISGGLSLGSFFNTRVGGISSAPQKGYSISGRSTLNIYGFSIPFSVQFNEQGRSFSQPFNRFGLTPEYKWLKLYLGWRSMNMSQFTLANSSFFGAGIELTPWKLRMAAMYGRFNKAAGPEDKNSFRPQFERKGYAFKLGLGSDKNNFDFIFFKAEDDTLSVMATDSILNTIDANENAVLGIQSRFGFFKQKVKFHIDAALSAFTLNTRYKYVPTNLSPLLEKTSKIFAPNISSQLNYAGEAGMTLKFKKFSIATNYRRVMPEYKSLGANYIIDDVEAVTISPTFSLNKKKLIFAGSFGIQRNNLNGFRQRGALKKIGSANINYNPNPNFGIGFSYANYAFRQQVIRDNIIGDSLLIDQVNHNLSLTPRFTKINKKSIQNYILVFNYQVLDDRNSFTEQLADNTVFLANFNYTYTAIKSKLSITAGLNYFNFDAKIIDIQRFGVSVGLSKMFFKNKLRFLINTSVNQQTQSGLKSLVLAGYSGLKYKITKKFGLSLKVHAINNQNSLTKRTDIRSQIGLSLGF